jgi:hypothetical protein
MLEFANSRGNCVESKVGFSVLVCPPHALQKGSMPLVLDGARSVFASKAGKQVLQPIPSQSIALFSDEGNSNSVTRA